MAVLDIRIDCPLDSDRTVLVRSMTCKIRSDGQNSPKSHSVKFRGPVYRWLVFGLNRSDPILDRLLCKLYLPATV